MRRFTYDTISYNVDILADLVKLVGSDRIMMGTDYCFDIAYAEPVQIVEQTPGLTDSQRADMLGGTAARLLKIPAMPASA